MRKNECLSRLAGERQKCTVRLACQFCDDAMRGHCGAQSMVTRGCVSATKETARIATIGTPMMERVLSQLVLLGNTALMGGAHCARCCGETGTRLTA